MSRAENDRSKCSTIYVAFLVLLINQLANEPLVSAGKDKGDDIILAKGKIILRGGKGKGNIILDPGHSSDGGHHEMPPMMPMMGHFNPYAFYPMQHHQPQMMIRPIYIEDHSHMHQHQQQHYQMPQHHQMEEHHEQHQYHQEEPQHYEPQHHEVEQHHHEEHHEQPHYEHGGGGEEHQQQHEGYEHPMMSLLSMHGSGPRPIYQPQQAQQHLQPQQQQQQFVVQAYQQQPTMYAQLSPEHQAAAYQQAQYMAAEQEAAMRQQQQHQQQHQQELQQGQSSEVSSHSPADGAGGSSSASTSSSASAPTKATNPVTALLEKSANNPLIKRIKPLFKRNKDQKDSSQKKP